MMKNHLTQLPFLARTTRATVAGLQGWLKTLAGLRRQPAPRPARIQRDDAEAMNLLGLLCFKGRGIPYDHAQARHWFQKAAAAGSAAAMHNLGAMYEHGHGVAQDYAEARGWYRRAAEAGNAPAAERLYRLAAPVAPNAQLSTIEAPVGHRRLTPRNKICSLEWSKHGSPKRAKGTPGPLSTEAQAQLTIKVSNRKLTLWQ
jgi:TPR repeat protein